MERKGVTNENSGVVVGVRAMFLKDLRTMYTGEGATEHLLQGDII